MVEAIAGAGLAVLIGIVLFSLLMMAMQYAPMLVFFNNAPPIAAMKLSVSAFTRNIGPMLVYVTTYMFLAILASLRCSRLAGAAAADLHLAVRSYRDIFPLVEETPAEEASKVDPFTPTRTLSEMSARISNKEARLAQLPHNLFIAGLFLFDLLMTPAIIGLKIGMIAC